MKQILGGLSIVVRPPAAQRRDAIERAPASRAPLTGPMLHRDGGTVLVLKGRPTLDLGSFDAGVIGRQIVEHYRAEGPRFLRRLRGPFAIAITERDACKALLAIDRMGIERLCWSASSEALVFGTSAAAVAGCMASNPPLDYQALYEFMLDHMVAAPDTAYAGVFKLLPGSYLQLQDGRIEVARHWEPELRHAPMSEVAALRGEVLPTIERAIERAAPDARTGTFLSGGLDSSTVTGLLTRRGGVSAGAFSVGFGVEAFDELAFARIAARHFGCAHHVYEVVPQDIVDALPRIAAAYDEPFGNSSALPTFCCARFAKEHGAEHLLAGDGGDEIFGGNPHYASQKIFELYSRLPVWARRLLLDPVAAACHPESSPWPLRKLSSYVHQARIPLPERYERWNMIYREGAVNVFEPDFLKGIDTERPLRRMREVWNACPSDDLLDKMLWYDWKYTLADRDLRKVTTMCELAGIAVSFPMLDEALVELSIKVPSKAKLSGTELRTFYKSAVRTLLPPPIIAKKKHGFSLPFGVWLKTNGPLQEMVYAALGSLRTRGIVNRAFIDRLLEEHRAEDASYYGYAIWDLLMLEQWLTSTERQRGSALREATV